jgi:hypothetical protein
VEAAGVAEVNRELVANQSAATTGQEERTASETCAPLLVAVRGRHLTQRRAMLGRIALVPVPTG